MPRDRLTWFSIEFDKQYKFLPGERYSMILIYPNNYSSNDQFVYAYDVEEPYDYNKNRLVGIFRDYLDALSSLHLTSQVLTSSTKIKYTGSLKKGAQESLSVQI